MSLVQNLTPTNLAEEKQRFFDQDCKYNPQFKYQKLITTNKLCKYGLPKPEFIELAKELFARALHRRTREEINQMEGRVIDRKKATIMVNEFLDKNNLNNSIRVVWIKNHLSKASQYQDELRLRHEIVEAENKFLALLFHELGTHAIRRLNYVQQPFYKKKQELGFEEYLPTEEGLASFHSLLARQFKIDHSHAWLYMMTAYAQKHSFVETYNKAFEFYHNSEESWRAAAKLKRGLYDTSQGGGFTKGIIYLEGMKKVWGWLEKYNYDLSGLYLGKISTNDVAQAKRMNPEFNVHLPHFYLDSPEKYVQSIKEIAKLNTLDLLHNEN